MKHLVLLLIILSSCVTNKDMSKIKFTHLSSTTSEQQKIDYTMEVPKGYTLKMYKADGESGVSNEYWYSDSSVIYLSDFGVSINEDNITKGKYAGKKIEFSMKQNQIYGDTLVLEGKSKNGYWKEIIIGKVIFGYLNVLDQKKELFDKALATLKRKGK
jgi:hypothetical protein